MSVDQKQLDSLLNVIKTWIETESGPTRMKFHSNKLQTSVTILGYKKLILERRWDDRPAQSGSEGGG